VKDETKLRPPGQTVRIDRDKLILDARMTTRGRGAERASRPGVLTAVLLALTIIAIPH
jgi:hypothetical protein